MMDTALLAGDELFDSTGADPDRVRGRSRHRASSGSSFVTSAIEPLAGILGNLRGI